MIAQLEKIRFNRKNLNGRPHAIGKILGEGANSNVYALTKDGIDIDWCAKVVPIATVPTIAFQSTEEKNEPDLRTERRMYLWHFKGLQGDMIPRLPKCTEATNYLRRYKEDHEGKSVF